MTEEDYDGILATIAFDDGTVGHIVPSSEGYGIIDLLEDDEVYVTVPNDEVEKIRRGLTPGDKQTMIEAMEERIRELFEKR